MHMYQTDIVGTNVDNSRFVTLKLESGGSKLTQLSVMEGGVDVTGNGRQSVHSHARTRTRTLKSSTYGTVRLYTNGGGVWAWEETI